VTKVSHKADLANCNYTTWTNDTCGCTITYEWDKSTMDTPELREHRPLDPNVTLIGHSGPVEHHKKCKDHNHLEDTKHHFETVLEENQRKNRAHFHMNEGSIPIEWYWEGKAPNRILHVKGETHKSKHEAQAVIDNELTDHGKVVLD
jgi:hypothetical protein